MSQSLLHQVTYSDSRLNYGKRLSIWCLNPFYIRSRIPTEGAPAGRGGPGNRVSIPFTSGHVFRQLIEEGERLRQQEMSQSLLHQVTYSDKMEITVAPGQSPHVSIPFTSGHVFRRTQTETLCVCDLSCLNPFYIRSRIPTPGSQRKGRCETVSVSIPFTSGHVFRHG